jgi:hypothetical protein
MVYALSIPVFAQIFGFSQYFPKHTDVHVTIVVSQRCKPVSDVDMILFLNSYIVYLPDICLPMVLPLIL